MPRSLARRTRPTRKPSSRLGGTLPAKTTAVAYSIRYSRRLENSLVSAEVTSGPYSLISVCVPAIGSTMAVEVRECPSISTRSNGMAASERPSRMASPLRPPANPAASTGTSRVRRDLATLTPFPPASVMLSGALCLWPSVRLGTTSVLATAALRVTVSIMPLPTYLLVENPPHGLIPPVRHVDAGVTPALDHEVLAVVGGETVSQSPHRSPEAIFSGVENHAYVRFVTDGGRGHQALSRVRGRPRFDARGRPVSEQQLVNAG